VPPVPVSYAYDGECSCIKNLPHQEINVSTQLKSLGVIFNLKLTLDKRMVRQISRVLCAATLITVLHRPKSPNIKILNYIRLLHGKIGFFGGVSALTP